MSDAKPVPTQETPKRLSELRGLSVAAHYDAAQTTPSNARHWIGADALSAASSNSEAVRSTLRERSRYEISNNAYAKGMIETYVDEIIGTGPRHQLSSGSKRSKVDEDVERAFEQWKRANGFDGKISLAKKSEVASGEIFAVMTRGSARRSSSVSIFDPVPQVEMGLHLIEADQVADPTLSGESIEEVVSGIRYDQYGNPTAYHILNSHPGDALGDTSGRWVPADLVLHMFKPERPGDARGIPLITPALELFAYLRRYTLATVESAEHVANIAGMLYTDSPADGDAESLETLDTIDIERGQIMVMPYGWKYGQAQGEQPTTTYSEFIKQLLREIARALSLPFNIAAGDSSGYNYASGRLDHQTWNKKIRVEQSRLISTMLDPIFWSWFAEASRVDGILPTEARTESYRRDLRVSWFFDGSGHVDPTKEAQGQSIRLENGTTTLAEECAKDGRDWRDVMDQRKAEQEYAIKIGLQLQSKSENQTPPADTEDQDNQDGQVEREENQEAETQQ